jgi:hypothetical protein
LRCRTAETRNPASRKFSDLVTGTLTTPDDSDDIGDAAGVEAFNSAIQYRPIRWYASAPAGHRQVGSPIATCDFEPKSLTSRQGEPS